MIRGLSALLICCPLLATLVWLWQPVRPALAAPVAREKPEREIPLKDIFTSSDQGGLRQFAFAKGEYGHTGLQGVRDCVKRCQIETLLIARGDDPAAALWDAWNHLTWVTEKEPRAERKAREASKRYWAIVFLGIGPSTPNQWTLKSVYVFPSRIQVNCDTSERLNSATTDICYYLYLVPLGELKKGRYTLEIVDPSSGEPSLMRKQNIGAED